METVYVYCAVIGGAILVVQTILTVLGIGADDFDAADAHHAADAADAHQAADAEHARVADAADADFAGDHSTSLFLQILTFKSLVAFLTFFGLGGLAANEAGAETGVAAGVAAGAGIVAMIGIAQLMTVLSRLHSQGNLELRNAVGRPATVYLRIPADLQGAGKVHVTVQGRTAEVKAKTAGPELPTGAHATVVRLLGPDTLEVAHAKD